MKKSASVMMLLIGSCAIAQNAIADDWAQKVTKELCVVKGSEEKRSKMYEETPETKEM